MFSEDHLKDQYRKSFRNLYPEKQISMLVLSKIYGIPPQEVATKSANGELPMLWANRKEVEDDVIKQSFHEEKDQGTEPICDVDED